MRKLVWVGLPVHWKWKVFAMACLGHRRTSVCLRRTLDTSSLWSNDSCVAENSGCWLDRAAVINPVSLMIIAWIGCRILGNTWARMLSNRAWSMDIGIIIWNSLRSVHQIVDVWLYNCLIYQPSNWVASLRMSRMTGVALLLTATDVVLLPGLRTNSSKPSESWTSFVGVAHVAVFIIVWVWVANWSSLLVDIRIEVIWIGRSMHDVVVGHSDVRLPYLVQNWPASLGVDRWYLSHHLAVVCLVFASSLSCLAGTYLLRTTSFIMPMIPTLSLAGSVLRIVVTITLADLAALLLVVDPALLQNIS